MLFKKLRLTRHERRCATEFEGSCPDRPWSNFYEFLPFELIELAMRGEPKAAFVMGDRFDQGMDGLDADFEKALFFYRLGEEQNDFEAINNIGSMYFHGDGLPKDLELARQYFERAADGGVAGAMNNLGRMYLDGEGGLPVDIERGLALLERGARLHDVNAALKMQNIYDEGQYGQPVDMFRHIYWLWQSIYNGSGWACGRLADYLREGEIVRHQGPRAREFYERGMLHGDRYATLQLGIDYWSGNCGPRNFDSALHFLTMAEDMGSTFATECISKVRKTQSNHSEVCARAFDT